MRKGVSTGCFLGLLVIKSSTCVTGKHVTNFLWPGVEKHNASKVPACLKTQESDF